ncbi:MAG: hypothetical protein ACOZHQ_10480 [Thermodesulfobacteriota bacterium]
MRPRPQCPACNRRGWLLAWDARHGLCAKCAEAFRQEARRPSQAVMAALNRMHRVGSTPRERAELAQEIKIQGQALLELIKNYRLEPGETLQEVLRQARSQVAEASAPGPALGDE